MGLLNNILRELGLTKSRGTRRGTSGLTLPDPSEVKEKLEEAVEGLSGLKDVPKTLIDKLVEADEDFRGADRALRGARFRGKRK